MTPMRLLLLLLLILLSVHGTTTTCWLACAQVSFDLFLCGSMFLDVATTSVLANVTGGQVRHFPGFRRKEVTAQDLDISGAEIDMMVTEATESLCSHVRSVDCLCVHMPSVWHHLHGTARAMTCRYGSVTA